MHMFTMTMLRITKDQNAEMQTKMVHHKNILHYLRCGGADIATLQRSQANLWQVQPAHKLAFKKLITLLDDTDESEAAHAEFHAADDSTDKLSSEILYLMDEDMEIHWSSQADYFLNS